MKTKIAGFVLVVMAVAVVVVGFILPQFDKYIPTISIWNTIFEDYGFSIVGLYAGISIALLQRITIIKSIACLLACIFMGLLADSFVFSIFDLSLFPAFLIGVVALAVLLYSALIFLIKGVEFMFFSN